MLGETQVGLSRLLELKIQSHKRTELSVREESATHRELRKILTNIHPQARKLLKDGGKKPSEMIRGNSTLNVCVLSRSIGSSSL